MIEGNAYDTYIVKFDNGEKFALMATSKEMARLIGAELNPAPNVVNVMKADEWCDED